MRKEELIKRTKEFAHRCVKFTESLPNTYLGNHIRGQLIRCATSVAANYRATCIAQSKSAFIAKLSIVLEEADESYFWLEFSRDERVGDSNEVVLLLTESNELISIFVSARKTARANG